MYQMSLDKDSTITLGDEWLTPQEREEKDRAQLRAVQLRSKIQPSSTSSALSLINSTSTLSN